MARTNIGKIYRSKRWAKRWARGRPIRKVPGGWKIMSGRVRSPAQERVHRRRKYRRKKTKRRKSKNWIL